MMRSKNQIPVLLAVLVLLAAGSVQAAQMQARHADNGTFTLPSGAAETLWSQLDDPSGQAFTDQAFEAPYAAYDAQGGDDFVVTGNGWTIETINTPGSQLFAGANPFFVNHAFYADAGGAPGAVLAGCDFPGNTNFTSDGTGDISATVDCDAAAGTAWMSQQVREDFNPFGQHYWATRLTSNGAEGVFRNPGDGFGTGCLDWSPMNTVCKTDGTDWMFELLGTPITTNPVPAVGPFGLVLLIAAMGGGTAYVLGRRRTA